MLLSQAEPASLIEPLPFTQLPQAIYRAEQVRELDRIAIEEFNIPGEILMKRAGMAAFRKLLLELPKFEKLKVFCGTGNNGGDGFVIAKLAHEKGLDVEIIQLGESDKIRGDALIVRNEAIAAQVKITPFNRDFELHNAVIVDAMLGTGLQGDVRGDYLTAIELINNARQPVLAVDIPSGLDSDSGKILGHCINAVMTVTFIGLKRGLFTGSGPAHCGKIFFADLDIPAEIYNRMTADCSLLENHAARNLIRRVLPPRIRDGHKGHYGHVLVVGGDQGMAGAIGMAAQAAARSGAGLVSVATRPEHVNALVARCPEVMTKGVISGQELELLLQRPTVVVIGPGLGRSAWSEQMLQRVLNCNLPLVIDADGLNLLSSYRGKKSLHRENWALTPHPGEAARLLNMTTAEIESDRFAAVEKLQAKYGGVVLLKGAGTLIRSAHHTTVAAVGNPGMATGGMGDVLSGVIGGTIAQTISQTFAQTFAQEAPIYDAVCVSVYVHGRAADLIVQRDGERGLLATDLLPVIRRLVNGIDRL